MMEVLSNDNPDQVPYKKYVRHFFRLLELISIMYQHVNNTNFWALIVCVCPESCDI